MKFRVVGAGKSSIPIGLPVQEAVAQSAEAVEYTDCFSAEE